MHECPYCGMACDCDGDDTWLAAPDDCECECECLDAEEDDWDGDEFEDEYCEETEES